MEKYSDCSQELLALRPTGSPTSTPPERVGGLGTGGEGGIRNVGIFLSQKKSTTGWVTNSALANPIRVALQLITLAREKRH